MNGGGLPSFLYGNWVASMREWAPDPVEVESRVWLRIV